MGSADFTAKPLPQVIVVYSNTGASHYLTGIISRVRGLQSGVDATAEVFEVVEGLVKAGEGREQSGDMVRPWEWKKGR